MRFTSGPATDQVDPCTTCDEPSAEDMRCACGNLLARRVAEGVELKCRRCKRTVIIPLMER